MAAENDNTVHFKVGDEEYEYPDPFDLDVDEWVIIYDECGMILEDFAPFEEKKRERERVKRLRNPALMKALAMCGVIRTNPELDAEDARELVGKARMLTLLESMAPEEDAEDEPNPPTSGRPSNESEPQPSSLRSVGESSESTSLASPPSSATPDEEPAPTGTGG